MESILIRWILLVHEIDESALEREVVLRGIKVVVKRSVKTGV